MHMERPLQKMKAIIFLILAGLMSCNEQADMADKKSSQQAEAKPASSIRCYSYTTTADTILLKVIDTGNLITGTLVYALKEKDKNTGTIQGNMKGDILLADYKFMSEGIQSTRQVAFKKEGNTFVEGYGDFKNVDSLNFNTSTILVEIPCK